MTTAVLHDAEQKHAWELRGHWMAQRRIALILTDRCVVQRIAGYVERVSPTGAVADVAGWRVPLTEVLAIHRER